MVKRSRLWLIAAGLALMPSACGRNPAERQPSPPATLGSSLAQKTSGARNSAQPAAGACALVLKSEVEAELGEPVKEPEKIEMMGVHNCKYVAVNASPYKSVSISYREVPSRELWQRDIEEHAKIVPSPIISVAGVGDTALFWKDELNSGHLDVFKDSIAVSVSVDLGRLGSRDDSRKMKISKTLVLDALTRI